MARLQSTPDQRAYALVDLLLTVQVRIEAMTSQDERSAFRLALSDLIYTAEDTMEQKLYTSIKSFADNFWRVDDALAKKETNHAQ